MSEGKTMGLRAEAPEVSEWTQYSAVIYEYVEGGTPITVPVSNPTSMKESDSGVHFIVDAEGTEHILKPGWFRIRRIIRKQEEVREPQG